MERDHLYSYMLLSPVHDHRVSAKLGNSGKSGKNQGNAFCLKNIREKSGNLTNSRDNQGNIMEIVSLFFQ